MLEGLKEICGFIFSQKKYWLLPILVALFAVAGFIVLGQSSALLPFVYSFF